MYTEITIKAKLTEESDEYLGLIVDTYENINEDFDARSVYLKGVEDAILEVIQAYNEHYVIGDKEVIVGDNEDE